MEGITIRLGMARGHKDNNLYNVEKGRIQGGIGALHGFDWWPIKAYRPCPAFIQSDGQYRRSGPSLNELAFWQKTSRYDLNVSKRLNVDNPLLACENHRTFYAIDGS
ncbi:hypothetical protein L7F22_045157 [Adiantum nelumboides]|nr:hypothetical protein [Adiantum nelumboides]